MKNDFLTRGELRRRLPQWHVPDDRDGVYAPEAGIVNATLTVEVLAQGATLLENIRVNGIELWDRPTVVTDNGVFTCERLIVAAGA